VQRAYHHSRPEALARLAHPPPFALGPAFASRLGKRLPRASGIHVLVGVESRYVAADDLLAPVALDALRAGVPAGDDAVGVEQVQRIVHHALDQQPEALLGLAQRLLVALALGEVARDLREADELATLVAQRGQHHVGPEARPVLAHPPALVLEAPF